MSSRKREKISSKLDHKQEVFYPLDYSFKTLSVFEGKNDGISVPPSHNNLNNIVNVATPPPPIDIVMEKPRAREHQAVVNIEAFIILCSLLISKNPLVQGNHR